MAVAELVDTPTWALANAETLSVDDCTAPVPPRAIVVTPPGPSWVMAKLPGKPPLVLGLNEMETVQLPPTAMVAPQLLLWA